MSARPVRPRLVRALAAGLLIAAAFAGCYQTPQPACAFACASDGSCPDGYACDPQDRICHRQLAGGGLEACDQPFLDARALDAAPVDAAAVDASPIDAPIDATIDAP